MASVDPIVAGVDQAVEDLDGFEVDLFGRLGGARGGGHGVGMACQEKGPDEFSEGGLGGGSRSKEATRADVSIFGGGHARNQVVSCESIRMTKGIDGNLLRRRQCRRHTSAP